MKISTLVILGSALLGFVLSAQAKTQRIVGVVAGVSNDSLQVTTKSGAAESVRLDDKTDYMKWITHRPWGQDSRADRSSLLIGRCVSIEVRSGEPAVAKMVQISNEDAGSIWDPCKK
jgi:hypothetical protein